MFFIKPEVKISGQYKISQFWDISLSQQMLDAIRRVIVDNILFFSKTVHQGIFRSTVQLLLCKTSFLLIYGPVTVHSLTQLTTRFREPYIIVSISYK